MQDLRVLTLTHYGPTEAENRIVTLSLINIAMIAAEVENVSLQNRQVRRLQVLLLDGEAVDLALSDLDLHQLQQAVGVYVLPSDIY